MTVSPILNSQNTEMVYTYVTTTFKIIQNYHTNIKTEVYGV